jgi:hypothetical protein
MTKTPSSLQDLRRRIYRKAKSEPSHRFWGLFVHIAKLETLEEAYGNAKRNGGAAGIDRQNFEDIETQGRTAFLVAIREDPGAGSRLAAAPARTPAPCSASRRSASDPSFPAGHAPDGRSACPHYALHSVTPSVPCLVHLYVVKDLGQPVADLPLPDDASVVTATEAKPCSLNNSIRASTASPCRIRSNELTATGH